MRKARLSGWTVYAAAGAALSALVLGCPTAGPRSDCARIPVGISLLGPHNPTAVSPATLPGISAQPQTASFELRKMPPPDLTPQQQDVKVKQVVAAVKAKPANPPENSFCFVCHTNYRKESLVTGHAKKNIGCARCHGSSDKHSADEDGLAPPEVLYPRAAINPSCMVCHPVEKLAAEPKHEKVLLDEPGGPVCMDCHGKGHKLAQRTRVWNPWTSMLVYDDGVRMGEKNK